MAARAPHGIAGSAAPGGVAAAAVTEAGDMTDEDLVGAEGMPVRAMVGCFSHPLAFDPDEVALHVGSVVATADSYEVQGPSNGGVANPGSSGAFRAPPLCPAVDTSKGPGQDDEPMSLGRFRIAPSRHRRNGAASKSRPLRSGDRHQPKDPDLSGNVGTTLRQQWL